VKPPLLDLMLKGLKDAKGDAVTVEENEIVSAFKELASKGFFVEPSSAVAYAAYKKQTSDSKTSEDGNTVIILTGSGLKTMLKPSQVDSMASQYLRF
jgi:threonine synthase